jgi:hypothetical protein
LGFFALNKSPGKAINRRKSDTYLKFGKRRIALPGNRPLRIGLGLMLIGFGILGFLPILGFWMIPLGLLVLSVDLPSVRRFRRRLEVKWGRWRARRVAEKAASGVPHHGKHEPDKPARGA